MKDALRKGEVPSKYALPDAVEFTLAQWRNLEKTSRGKRIEKAYRGDGYFEDSGSVYILQTLEIFEKTGKFPVYPQATVIAWDRDEYGGKAIFRFNLNDGVKTPVKGEYYFDSTGEAEIQLSFGALAIKQDAILADSPNDLTDRVHIMFNAAKKQYPDTTEVYVSYEPKSDYFPKDLMVGVIGEQHTRAEQQMSDTLLLKYLRLGEKSNLYQLFRTLAKITSK